MPADKRIRHMTEAPTSNAIAQLYTPGVSWKNQRVCLRLCLEYTLACAPFEDHQTINVDQLFSDLRLVTSNDQDKITAIMDKLIRVIERILQNKVHNSHATRIGLGIIATIIGDICFVFDNETDSTWFKIAHSLCPVYPTRVYARTAIAFARAGNRSGYYWAHRAIEASIQRQEQTIPAERLLFDLANRYYHDEVPMQVFEDENPWDTHTGLLRDPANDIQRVREYIVQRQLEKQANLPMLQPVLQTTPNQQIVFAGIGIPSGKSTLINRLAQMNIVPTHDTDAFPCIITVVNEPERTQIRVSAEMCFKQFDDDISWGSPNTPELKKLRSGLFAALGIDVEIDETTVKTDVIPDYDDFIDEHFIEDADLRGRDFISHIGVIDYITSLIQNPVALFIKEITIRGPIPALPPNVAFVEIPAVHMYSPPRLFSAAKLKAATKLVFVDTMHNSTRFNPNHGTNRIEQTLRAISNPQIPIACCLVGITPQFLKSHFQTQIPDAVCVRQLHHQVITWLQANQFITPTVFALDNTPFADASRPALYQEFFRFCDFVTPNYQ